MHRLIVRMTLFFLLAALAASVGSLVTSPDWEPAVTSLTLLAAITGLFIDRWLAEREHRRQMLQALVHEIYMNLGVLQEIQSIASNTETSRPKMMPRFYNSTLATVIASGTFATDKDAKLWKLLHAWMQRSTEANNRFPLTEAYTMEHPEAAAIFLQKMKGGAVITTAEKTLRDLSSELLDAYSKESGIDRETVLFAVPSDGPAA